MKPQDHSRNSFLVGSIQLDLSILSSIDAGEEGYVWIGKILHLTHLGRPCILTVLSGGSNVPGSVRMKESLVYKMSSRITISIQGLDPKVCLIGSCVVDTISPYQSLPLTFSCTGMHSGPDPLIHHIGAGYTYGG